MTAATSLVSLVIALAILFVIIYLSYLVVSWKQCTQRELLKTSATLFGASFVMSLAGVLLQGVLPGGLSKLLVNIAFFVLMYILGRRQLRLSRKRAILAVCIPLSLTLLGLAMLIVFMQAY
ncbi:MAG: hypothetical protein IKA23_02505 [Akkermansia sp.]|nr:hypothetical protein [Akkermansia sp.]